MNIYRAPKETTKPNKLKEEKILVEDREMIFLDFECVDCGSSLNFVGDYLVVCHNFSCPMYGIEFDAG